MLKFNPFTENFDYIGDPSTGAGDMTAAVYDPVNGNRQVAFADEIPANSDLTYYLQDGASDVASNKKMLHEPLVSENSVTVTNVTNNQLLQSWTTELNSPNLTFIPAGHYIFHIHALKTLSLLEVIQVYAEIWEVDSSGTDIVKIGTTGNTTPLTTGKSEYEIDFSLGDIYIPASTSSRIKVKTFSNISGVGTGDVTLYYGGTSDSHLGLPANAVNLTNYVPYTGASGDVNLGSWSMIAKYHKTYESGANYFYSDTGVTQIGEFTMADNNIIYFNGIGLKGIVFNYDGLTGQKTFTFPDKDGTFAMTSDIPTFAGDVVGPASAVDSNFASYDTTTGKLIKDSGYSAASFATPGDLSGLVPYTGSSSNLEMGANVISTQSSLNLDSGSTINFFADVGMTLHATLSADFVGKLQIGSGSANATLDISSLTADHSFTFPDKDGTIATLSDLSSLTMAQVGARVCYGF